MQPLLFPYIPRVVCRHRVAYGTTLSTKLWRTLDLPHKRSLKKLEERIAKQYAYKHSVSACRNNDPDEMRERIYTGTSQDCAGAVLSEMKGERNGLIPDYPQGLVISDSRGEGYFDITI